MCLQIFGKIKKDYSFLKINAEDTKVGIKVDDSYRKSEEVSK